jgi:hypothetical protein
VAEEVRFFLRTALYSAVISVVYWFSSREAQTGAYDWAGTMMLLFTALAAGGVVMVLIAAARGTTRGLLDNGSLPGLASRLVGFTDPAAGDERPLSAGLEPIPTRSPWPAAAGLAATLIGTGLVFGPWLWLPGVALLAATVWGWIAE